MGRRKAITPQRLASLQDHNAWVAQRALQARQAELREEEEGEDFEEEENESEQAFRDDDDYDEEEDDLQLMVGSLGGTPRVGSKRRRRESGSGSSTVSPFEKKRPRSTRRRLRREGRLIPIEEEEEEEEKGQEVRARRFFEVVAALPGVNVEMALLNALPIEDQKCRALLLRQWIFHLPSEPPLPQDPKLATYTFTAGDGTRFLCIADHEGEYYTICRCSTYWSTYGLPYLLINLTP